jgi:cytochrome P450
MMEQMLWRPLDPENVRDPYRMYDALRNVSRIYQAHTGEYIVTGYEEVKAILKSQAFRTGNRLDWLKRQVKYLENKEQDLQDIHEAMNSFILMLNPPQHTRIRNFVNKAWDHREVDHIIQRTADHLLDQIGDDRFDIAKEYAQPLPVIVICEILGITITEYHSLIDLAIAMNKTLDLYVSVKDLVSMNEASNRFISFFQQHIKAKEDRPDESLLSKMIRKNHTENFGLTTRELTSIGIFLFIAGAETAASLITNCFFLLARYPDQLNLLQQQPELLGDAIEEVLRLDPPVQLLGRVSTIDFSLNGTTIPSNATVTLVVGAANRDESVFSEPNTFLITRKPNRHISFGSGIHFCLGDWLGKREAQIAVRSFFLHYNHLRIAEQELSWNKNLAIRRLAGLVVSVSRA